jgi:group I intron endonuclease
MDKISGVYKITNTQDGKFYIGSSNNIYARKARHKRELNAGVHNNSHLQRAWNKYGEGAFHFEVLTECDESDRLETEQREINKALENEPKKLYNIAKNTLAPMTGITSPMKGKNHSDETRQKMSISHKGKTSPNKGNRLSKYARAKMSRSRKAMVNAPGRYKPIVSEETITEIRQLYSTKEYTQAELSKLFGMSRPHMCSIINNKRRSNEEYEKIKPLEIVKKPVPKEVGDKISAALTGKKPTPEECKRRSVYNPNNKAVVQIGDNGSIINTYRSANEAGRRLKIDNSAISRACRGEYKKSGGFCWMYYDDYIKKQGEAVELA